MASNDPIIGDLTRAREQASTSEFDTNWFAYDPFDYTYTADWGEGQQTIDSSQFYNLSQQGFFDDAEEFSMLDPGFLSMIEDPAFATFYNQFMPQQYQGETVDWSGVDLSAARNWWRVYGEYFDVPYDERQEIMLDRNTALNTEKWRLDNLKTLDKMGGYVGKTKFAGDSQYVKATEDLMENAIRTKDLQTLGVNASLWDMKDSHVANMYSMFGQLAGSGAFDEGGAFETWDPNA